MTGRYGLVRAAAALLVVSLLAGGCGFQGVADLPLPAGAANGDDVYRVTVQFRDALNLVPESTVKVDDVTVGAVDAITREGWHALVTLRLEDGVRLPDNAAATIAQTSLLGEKYVALHPPTGEPPQGRLSEGDRIPLSRTGGNTEVEQVLGAMSLLLNGGGIAQLRTITRELNNVMAGREDRIRSLLHELNTFVGTLDEQKAQIVRAIEGLDRLSARLARDTHALGDAIDAMGPGLAVLADQRKQLVTMLDALSRLGEAGTRVIRQSTDDTVANLNAMVPILTKLADAGDDLPRALEILPTFPYPDEALNAFRGDYINVSMRADISLVQLYRNMAAADGRPGDARPAPPPERPGDPPAATPPAVPLPAPEPPPRVRAPSGDLGGLLTGGLR